MGVFADDRGGRLLMIDGAFAYDRGGCLLVIDEGVCL